MIAVSMEEGESSSYAQKVVRAMKYVFDIHLIEGKHFLEDDAIKRMVKAVQPRGRVAHDMKRSTKREPVTWDVVQWIRDAYVGTGHKDGLMVYIGVVLAYNFMWRCSEFIVTRVKDLLSTDADVRGRVHAIRRKDVTCFNASNNIITENEVLHLHDRACVRSITFVLPSSKADQRGRGRFLTLTRGGDRQDKLVDDVVNFLQWSGTKGDDLLLSRWNVTYNRERRTSRRLNRKLTRKMVSSALREAAVHFGLDKFTFAIHSLRIGGATQMTTAQEDRRLVSRVGGWDVGPNSRIHLYERSTSHDHGTVGTLDRIASGVLSSDSTLTTEHLRIRARGKK